jgi:hypothetical protein
MFAHQVIESLKLIDVARLPMRDFIITSISNAQQFHMGNIEDLQKFSNHLAGHILFKDDMAENVRLPYKLTWFDYTSMSKNKPSKIGILAEENKKDEIVAIFFGFSSKLNFWVALPYRIKISIGTGCSELKNLYSDITKEEVESHFQLEKGFWLGGLNISLLFLSCKNIGVNKILPPEKLNFKRKNQGKTPLFSYHVLYLRQTSPKEKSIPQNLWKNRIHLCRGHFKLYTIEHPLFGKFTGRYWWQAQARGNRKMGIILKDYEICPTLVQPSIVP